MRQSHGGTLDSQVTILPFSDIKEIPKLFGRPAHEISDRDIEEITGYAADCFDRKYHNRALDQQILGPFRRKLVAIVATSKELIRQDQVAKAAQERLRQQQAREEERRERERQAVVEQQARDREAQRLAGEKRQRERSERQAQEAVEQAKRDREQAAEVKRQIEIERQRLDEGKKIAEEARKERETAERELMRLRQDREGQERMAQADERRSYDPHNRDVAGERVLSGLERFALPRNQVF